MLKYKLKFFHLFLFFFIFVLHQYLYLDFFPNENSKLGHDFEYFLPNFIFGKVWFQKNFLSLPWFNPALCCGIPFHADPQTGFYSIQQIFYILFEPITATKILFTYFSFFGFLGMYLLLRKNFKISFLISLLGATMFIFNGFFIFRFIVGHIAYINFSLIPIYCYFLIESFTNKNIFLKKVYLALSALVLSSFFYSGASPIMPLLIICIFSILLFFYLKTNDLNVILFCSLKSFFIAFLISSSKITASLFFLKNFNRKIQPIYFENSIEYLNVIFKSLFFFPDLKYFNQNILNKNINNFSIHEIEYGITFIPLFIFLLFLLNFKKFFKLQNFNKVFLFSLGIFVLPIFLNINLFNFQSFWNSIPIIGSSWVQVRWSAIYIIPLILFTVIILEKLNFNKYKILILIPLFFAIFFQNIYRDKSYYNSQLYDPKDMVELSQKLNDTNFVKNFSINGYATVVNKDDQIILNNLKRNDYFAFNLSSAYCYQPLFGYNLEKFPNNNILFNKKVKLSPERDLIIGELNNINDKKKFNFFNPSCFLFPNENNCLPGDLFDKTKENSLKDFLNYKKFDFRKNIVQNISDYLSLVSLIMVIIFLIRNLYLYKKT